MPRGLNKATYSFRTLVDLFFYCLVILKGGSSEPNEPPLATGLSLGKASL